MAVPFSALVEEALYAPGTGFYERGGAAGRARGDFLTSPEVGPLFGAVLARALDAWWAEGGRPDPFVVDEHGAGPGTLLRTVLRAGPACGPALRWTLVERSAAQRERHREHLPGPPAVTSAATPPERPAHVVLANELLDNLPFDLFAREAGEWREVRVEGSGAARSEVLVPAAPHDAARLAALAPEALDGARAPLQRQAAGWVADRIAGLVPGGRLLVLDYASTTAEMARRPWTEWLRTYRGHARGAAPLEAVGEQDVTVEVAVDQLPPPALRRTQADLLRAWGIDELVEEGRRDWAERPGPADLAALVARSRVTEAEALLDPAGLGAFAALEWTA